LRIIDDSFSIYYPAIISVETLDCKHEIDRIMIYDTRFVRLLKKGDVIEINGLIQKIEETNKNQILIGSKQYSTKENINFSKISR